MPTVTRDALLSRATRKLVLPAWSQEAGEPQEVTIRRMTAGELRTVQPPPAPGQHEWPPEERADRLRAWRASLSEEERRRLDDAWLAVDFEIISRGLLEPRVSPEEARAFGLDVDFLVFEILTFSGLVGVPGDSEAEKDSADASPADAGAPN